MNYLKYALYPSFYHFLQQLDVSIAEETRNAGCMHCKGPLHRSNWKRAGYGLPVGCRSDVMVRISFLCSRRCGRTTPNSLIWMYYRHYASPAQFLLPALERRIPKKDLANAAEKLGISANLLGCWRRWWKSGFFDSMFFRRHQGLGMFCRNIPADLLSWFLKRSLQVEEVLTRALRFLSMYRTDRLHLLHPSAVERLQEVFSHE